MANEGRERFAADVVFDALGIRFGDWLRYSEGNQEFDNGFMALAGFSRQTPSIRREEDRSVRLARHEALALQAFERAVCRHMCDAQPASEIGEASLPCPGYQLGDHLDIILGEFLRMILAGARGIAPQRKRFGPGPPLSHACHRPH